MPFEDLHGPGGLLTTTADLLRWNNLFRNHSIFNKEYASDRITERKLNDGRGTGYAAGLTIDKVYGYEQIAHSGYTAGYRAWLAWYPQKQLSVVILSNYGQFNPVDCGRQVAAIFLDQEPQQLPVAAQPLPAPVSQQVVAAQQQPAPVPQQVVAVVEQGKILKKQGADLTQYAGNYYSPDIETIYRLFVQNAQLKVRRRAEDVFTLQHLSGDSFISEENGEFQFIRNRKGRVTGFKVSVSRAADVPFNLLPAGFQL